ncbi:hypothetical protein RB594_008821 [Gaeumannomyces avenae]
MASATLSTRDMNVLEKIKDPEFDPAAIVRIEDSLPADPHIKDEAVYKALSAREREIVLRMHEAETQLEKNSSELAATETYKQSTALLGQLIEEHPDYASARNNRAQALRRLYGDSMLVSQPPETSPRPLVGDVADDERVRQSKIALEDLDKAILLLSPRSPWTPISAKAAKTLSLAHTQRAAIYHATSKLLAQNHTQIDHGRKESGWKTLEFEAAASHDFAVGGRYGNEIAKGLAVSTNPTAKLCGQMVQEMMRKEYGEKYAQ